jgi:uncharacterized coiled-coil DUF342 family protein
MVFCPMNKMSVSESNSSWNEQTTAQEDEDWALITLRREYEKTERCIKYCNDFIETLKLRKAEEKDIIYYIGLSKSWENRKASLEAGLMLLTIEWIRKQRI